MNLVVKLKVVKLRIKYRAIKQIAKQFYQFKVLVAQILLLNNKTGKFNIPAE